jgi:hypothetical protein
MGHAKDFIDDKNVSNYDNDASEGKDECDNDVTALGDVVDPPKVENSCQVRLLWWVAQITMTMTSI